MMLGTTASPRTPTRGFEADIVVVYPRVHLPDRVVGQAELIRGSRMTQPVQPAAALADGAGWSRS